MSVDENITNFWKFIFLITMFAVVVIPLCGFCQSGCYKFCTLATSGVFPLLTLWTTSYVWFSHLSGDEEKNEDTESRREIWSLATAMFASGIVKCVSVIGHPKMQWFYCINGRMSFMKRIIRSAADVYLVVVSGWEMICTTSKVADQRSPIANLLPFHGVACVGLWGVLVLVEDLRRFMKDHNDAEKQYELKNKPPLPFPPYLTCCETIEENNYVAFEENIEGCMEVWFKRVKVCCRSTTLNQGVLSKYLTVNNTVTLVQLWIALLTGEAMVWISCLIKMSADGELEREAFIEPAEEPEE